ncbi:MAG: DUF2877 domain-containing protein [Anaerolineaceae bacterium]|nr:DUF2877 domain-containing protein [Anaerolineaceae bacterium]
MTKLPDGFGTANKKSPGSTSVRINAVAVGHIAKQTLEKESSAKIWGHTSRGMFALTGNKGILFISGQKHKGPLTINIHENILETPIQIDEMQLILTPALIRCPQINYEIRIGPQTPIWNPTLPKKLNLNPGLLLKRSKLLEDQLNNQYPNKRSGFSLSNNGNFFKYDSRTGNHSTLTNNLLIATSSKNETAIYASLMKFLGLGEGLTPSGDDFICGFLLAAYLWQGILYPQLSFQNINQRIVSKAWEKTSTLSANLITCATIGSADERIINCIQWLSSMDNSSSFMLEELLSYGNSSGSDVLAGILTFIQSSPAFAH